MRKRKLRGGIAVLSLVAVLGVGHGVSVYADDAQGGDSLVTADPSKGIEYLYEDGSTTPSGIVLNGNSVIIKKSENSTDSNKLYNVYNDANKNGVLDDGEEEFTIDGNADFSGDNEIYGAYKEKVNAPISITLEDAQVAALYGIYGGAIDAGSEENAISIRVDGESGLQYICGAYQSNVTGDISLTLDGKSSMNMSQAAMQSSVSGDVNVNVRGNAVAKDVKALASTYCTGNLTIDTESTVDVNSMQGLYSSTIDGDITENINYSTDNGNVSAVTYGYYSGKDYSVQGNVIFNMKNAAISQVYPLSKGVKVKKNVSIDIQNSKANSMSGLSDSADVLGNVKVIVDGMSSVNSYSLNINGVTNSQVSGDYTFNLANTSGDSVYIYGISSASVLGNVDIDMNGNGAKVNDLYGIKQSNIDGSTDIDIENWKSDYYKPYALSSVTFAQTEPENADAYANVITMKNISCGGDGVQAITSVKDMASVHLIMDNVNVKDDLYGIYNNMNMNGRIKVDVSGCSAKNLYAFSPQYYSEMNGDVELNVSDSRATNSMTICKQAKFMENLKINVKDVVSKTFQGCYGGTYSKDVDIVVNGVNDTSYVDESGSPVVDSYADAGKGDFAPIDNCSIAGNFTADISKVHFASCGLAGGSYNCGYLGPKIDITLADSSFNGSSSNYVYLLKESYNGNVDYEQPEADIRIKNTDFSKCTSAVFVVGVYKNRKTDVTIDDTCVMPDDYYMYPSYNGTNGFVTMTYDGNIYYGGDKVVLDKDVTAKNIYFGSRNENCGTGGVRAVIEKGANVTATEGIYVINGSNVLNKGTI